MKHSLMKFRTIYWVCSLFFLTCWIVVSQTRLMECLSNSLTNVHYILFLKSHSINRGDIVAIQGHREGHLGLLKKWPYSKRVLGIPGDQIVHTNGKITIIPQESYLLSLVDKTSKGLPLTPIAPHAIPEGYLFVAGDNPQSFDSRYAEFGLVPISKIWGRGIIAW